MLLNELFGDVLICILTYDGIKYFFKKPITISIFIQQTKVLHYYRNLIYWIKVRIQKYKSKERKSITND